MKYKVGDKVRVVALEGFQDGRVKIGDIVTITRTHSDHSHHHYTVKTEGGGYIWWFNDNEIELYEEKKMPKYTTEPIDYTGCHPVIAEHLKRGEAILCRVRHSKDFDWNRNDFMVESYSRTCEKFNYIGYFPSSCCRSSFVYAEPIPVKRKVLMSAEKAVVKLIENGSKVDKVGCIDVESKGEHFIYLSCLKDHEGEDKKRITPNYPDYLFEEVDD